MLINIFRLFILQKHIINLKGVEKNKIITKGLDKDKESGGSVQAVTKKEGLLKRVKLFKIKHR